MNNSRPPPSVAASGLSARSKEEWEEWEDDEVVTPSTTRNDRQFSPESGMAGGTVAEAAGHSNYPPSQRTSILTMTRIQRLRSRRRQLAQNEMFGIKVVTDMAKLREQQQQQQRQMYERRQTRTGKFVDAAALRALEGSPSDESIGTLAWLRGRSTKGKRVEQLTTEASQASQADLSPNARPIVIGFEVPAGSDIVVSPQTAVVETPVDFPAYFKKPPAPVASPNQPVSAWSPDTEDYVSPQSALDRGNVPAVPSIPQQYWSTDSGKKEIDSAVTPIYVEDDDDMATPVTLFEEDGSPVVTQRSPRVNKGIRRSATVASTQSQGWWDQVTSPFGPPTPQSPASSQKSPNMSQALWKEVDKKQLVPPTIFESEAESSTGPRTAATQQPQTQTSRRAPEIVIHNLSSGTMSPSSSSSSSSTKASAEPAQQSMAESEKPLAAVAAHSEALSTPRDQPPPYSPPSNKHRLQQPTTRYHAVFPSGHPLATLYPPSPGPVPPGLANTMTSQGAINLTDVPLTPASKEPQQAHLPDRPLGSFVPGDHFASVNGRGPRQEAERRRRRHEKEDAIAWRAGRFWHGRGGCSSCCGLGSCFGRPGREGRKRRRICFGVCAALVLILAGVGVALGILLTRRSAEPAEPPSRFFNVTGFPPVPKGVSTIIAPDSKAVTACVQPPSLWACALPKEQHATGVTEGFGPDQPPFIIQIQYDSDRDERWRLPSGDMQTIPSTAKPNPPPPSLREIAFLGNFTDGVVSSEKAGEPTPFFISILRSINDTVGPDELLPQQRRRWLDWLPGQITRRQTQLQPVINASALAPPPELDPDGSGRGAPAVLLPFPTQQPLRLYDRGLPTERLAFYSYFNKTTYVRSITPLIGNGPNATPVPEDANGGSLRSEARFLVTWLFVRYKVEIWTRATGTLDGRNSPNGTGTARLLTGRVSERNETQPGTFPYPVTVTLDTHGGPHGRKFAFVRGVDERQRIVLDDAKFVANRMNTTGDHVNPANDFDESLGGLDGGTGGCRCEYKNFLGVVNGRE
ncbi:hypothetical protein VTJ49DRAFT_3343 [Mycothermus thermophilus]|uniref:Glycoprotease family protein n=1 Tax=Humicola insolens TaxID=85995 RepID=A0ABR3VMB3_HUMIN